MDAAAHIAIRDYPQLQSLAWQLSHDMRVTDAEALNLYERNWRFIQEDQLDERERALIERLKVDVGHGVLHV